MAIKKLTIQGIRGYANKTDIEFAMPDKKTEGSGLTIIVGANNSGKSTIIEAIHMLMTNEKIVFSNSIRSVQAHNGSVIEVIDSDSRNYKIQSVENNPAYVERFMDGEIFEGQFSANLLHTFILSNKRNMSSTFYGGYEQRREDYLGNIGNNPYRSDNNTNNNFGGRLANIIRNRQQFDDCLREVINPVPQWEVDKNEQNGMILNFVFDNIEHSSNGAGDGFINIFNIVDALYDSTEDNVILIDEPEVSLHPDLQRKLFKLLVKYSKDKQIIITTHSPFFVDWNIISNGAKIIRTKKNKGEIELYELREETKNIIRSIINDTGNLHTLGINANEIFFLNDNVIVTEGQEDVYWYKKIFESRDCNIQASFFGWGAGGAPKIKMILSILRNLGYKKVFTIYDGDKQNEFKKALEAYNEYSGHCIAAKDIRNKNQRDEAQRLKKEINEMEMDSITKTSIIQLIDAKFPDVKGLIKPVGSEFEINPEYNNDVDSLIKEINEYFTDSDDLEVEENNITNETNKQERIKESPNNAEQILNDFLYEKKYHEKIIKKFNYLDIRAGSGGCLSIKKIKDNIYYAIIENGINIGAYEYIEQGHFMINTSKKTVKRTAKKVIKNTLPKKYAYCTTQ